MIKMMRVDDRLIHGQVAVMLPSAPERRCHRYLRIIV